MTFEGHNSMQGPVCQCLSTSCVWIAQCVESGPKPKVQIESIIMTGSLGSL